MWSFGRIAARILMLFASSSDDECISYFTERDCADSARLSILSGLSSTGCDHLVLYRIFTYRHSSVPRIPRLLPYIPTWEGDACARVASSASHEKSCIFLDFICGKRRDASRQNEKEQMLSSPPRDVYVDDKVVATRPRFRLNAPEVGLTS